MKFIATLAAVASTVLAINLSAVSTEDIIA